MVATSAQSDAAPAREQRIAGGGAVLVEREDWTIVRSGKIAKATGPGGVVQVIGDLVTVSGIAPAQVVTDTIAAAQPREARRG